jgi:hypothetical protein
LPYCDAISIHPYRGNPDGADLEISELKRIIAEANGGVSKPIWATEFSASSLSEADRPYAAAYLAQIAVLMMSQGVDRLYYYLMVDGGSFKYRGLVGVSPTFVKHITFEAYATLIKQLGGALYRARFTSSPSTYAYWFTKGTTKIAALWSNLPVVVDLSTASPVTVVDLVGNSRTLTPDATRNVRITLTRDMQYVVGPVGSIKEINNTLLADSLSGYSNIQGKNGWYYGYAAVGTTNLVNLPWAIWGGSNYRWGSTYPFITSEHMHPETSAAVRRWVSSYSGNVSLEGKMVLGAGGDGVEARFYVDGVEIYRKLVPAGQTVQYSVPATIAIGSKVDFTINRVASQSYDATGFEARIIKL